MWKMLNDVWMKILQKHKQMHWIEPNKQAHRCYSDRWVSRLLHLGRPPQLVPVPEKEKETELYVHMKN